MNTFLTYILTTLIPLVCGGYSFAQTRLEDGHFFSKQYTDVLKGLCCLIVIYVHVRPERGNVLQDAIGSFAYVAVTFFFLVSAYGMMAGVEKKNNYLKSFWRNRLVSLLIPCLLINIIGFVLNWAVNGEASVTALYSINSYVLVLLQWCVWFYIVQWCRMKWFAENIVITDSLLIAGVVITSLYLYFFGDAEVMAVAGWCFERIGLVWGVLLYRYFDVVTTWIKKSRVVKLTVLLLLGGFLGVSYLKFKFEFFWGAYLLKIVLGFTLLLLLFAATSNRRLGDKVSNWLGSISYEVYLSHGLVLGIMALLVPLDFNSGLYLFLAISATLLLSTCVHAIGKPIVNILRKK